MRDAVSEAMAARVVAVFVQHVTHGGADGRDDRLRQDRTRIVRIPMNAVSLDGMPALTPRAERINAAGGIGFGRKRHRVPCGRGWRDSTGAPRDQPSRRTPSTMPVADTARPPRLNRISARSRPTPALSRAGVSQLCKK